MNPSLIINNDTGIILDYKAHRAVIDALRFQLANWQTRRPDEMGEDDFAALQNDIGYLGSLLARLEQEHTRLNAAAR